MMRFLTKMLLKKSHPEAKKQTTEQQRQPQQSQSLTTDLRQNLSEFQQAFGYPDNISFKTREVYIPSVNRDAVIMFLEGTVDTRAIENHIVEPLLESSAAPNPDEDIAVALLKKTLTACTGKPISVFEDGIVDMLGGNSVLLIDGQADAISIETPGFEKRPVSTPKLENVLKGPKEAFVESGATNRSLIRKQLKDQHLMCESIAVGQRTGNQVYVMYLSDIANSDLVEKVKQRIRQIQSDAVQDLSLLEQHIEERPYSLVPSTLMTERPDRTCSFLLEGHIALLMDNSPYALVVPVTFWALFHTSEDQYLRWAYGNFIRLVRLLALFVALLTPSIYISVSTFHEEMIQTDLLLAIAATREKVPFPAIVEVMLMEIAFELLREAGVRIPTIIGPTIGIVGALILGQAAVDANIISPILVIIVAITGLSSFAIPELSFNFGVRILRFFILFTAAFMGFYGIALFLTALLAYLVSLKSFGVPFLSPLAPYTRSSGDMLIRLPIWKQWLRPYNLSPKVKIRRKQPEGSSNQ